jgi:hypothetical protein
MDAQETENPSMLKYFMHALDYLLDKHDENWQAKLSDDSGVDRTTINKVHKGLRKYSPEAQELIARGPGFSCSLDVANLGRAIHDQEEGWVDQLNAVRARNIMNQVIKKSIPPEPATPEQLRIELGERPDNIVVQKHNMPDAVIQRANKNIELIEFKNNTPVCFSKKDFSNVTKKYSQLFEKEGLLGWMAASASLSKRTDMEDEFVKVPMVEARLSAGGGSLETSSEVKSHLAFRRDWLARKGRSDRMVVMCVVGESMWPKIENGDALLIDQSQTELIQQEVYAVALNGELLVKRVNIGVNALDDIISVVVDAYSEVVDNNSDDVWAEARKDVLEKYQLITLESDLGTFNQKWIEQNKVRHLGIPIPGGPYTIFIEKADEFKVLGRVVWLGRDLGK